MTDIITPAKKKRTRKPAPTTYEKTLVQASDLDLEDKINLRNELNDQLEAERTLLTAKLSKLGAIGVE